MRIASFLEPGPGRLGAIVFVPATGAFVLTLALSAGLAGTLGVSLLWAIFLACVPMIVALAAHHVRAEHRFGLANAVTLVRAGLAAALAAPLFQPIPVDPSWPLLTIALLLVTLDGLDGWIARRRGEVTAFGARFDMEADTLLLAVLALLVLVSGRAGVWLLLAPAFRPLFLLGGRIWPSLTAPLPPSMRRKFCCVAPLLMLAIALAPSTGQTTAALLALSAVLMLGGSFAVDLRWLVSHRAEGSAR